jgi:hypothetical protein
MTGTVRGIAKRLAVAAAVAALLLGVGQPPAVDAAKVRDARPVNVKVRSFSSDCGTMGGTATVKNSPFGGVKHVTCTGGGLGGTTCTYTSRTSNCHPAREAPDQPAGEPGQIEAPDLDRAQGSEAGPRIASTDRHQDHGKSGHGRRT